MRELFEQHGLMRRTQSAVQLQAADRRTEPTGPGRAFAFPVAYGTKPYYERRQTVRRVKDLINFSQSPLPSRAIRLIRNGISSLQFGIRPKEETETKGKEEAYKKADALVRAVLNKPSVEEDFQSFLGQIIEDICLFDAGVWEYVDKPKFILTNPTLALEVVPGYTMAKNSKWKGEPKQARWIQLLDDGRVTTELLDRDIEYMMYRKRSFDPFGLSPLETAIEIMESWLGISSYQRQIASEAYPGLMLYLGDEASEEQVLAFRAYWRSELQGRGTPGMLGGTGKPVVLPLKPNDDGGLFLQYTEALTRLLAICFDLHPMDFGLERDVNRNTSEVQSVATSQEAILPLANLIASRMNSRVFPRIAEIENNPLILELEFFWVNLNPKDKEQQSRIDNTYANLDALTMDELRANQDKEPYANGLGKLTPTAFRTVIGQDPTILMEPEGTDLKDRISPQIPEGEPLPFLEEEPEEEPELPVAASTVPAPANVVNIADRMQSSVQDAVKETMTAKKISAIESRVDDIVASQSAAKQAAHVVRNAVETAMAGTNSALDNAKSEIVAEVVNKLSAEQKNRLDTMQAGLEKAFAALEAAITKPRVRRIVRDSDQNVSQIIEE